MRELLALIGVTDQQIDSFLNSGEAHTPLTVPQTIARHWSLQNFCDTATNQRPPSSPAELSASLSEESISRSGNNSRRSDSSMPDPFLKESMPKLGQKRSDFDGIQLSDRSHLDPHHTKNVPGLGWVVHSRCARSKSWTVSSVFNEEEFQPPPLFMVSDSSRDDSRETTSDERMLEMPCETAAEIIAGMRGCGDMSLARYKLGCVPEKQCKVKNVDVLQILELDE